MPALELRSPDLNRVGHYWDYAKNYRIAAFRKANPDNQIIILLTEFACRKWGVESFNHHGNVFDAATIAISDVLFRILRDDFGHVGVGAWLKLFIFFPLLILHMVPYTVKFIVGRLIGKQVGTPLASYIHRQQRVIYMHLRYLGLKTFLPYFNAVVASHENIFESFENTVGINGKPLQYFGVLYPEFRETIVINKLMKGKKLFMEITGSLTRYRQKWINRINRYILHLLISDFSLCLALPFSPINSGLTLDRGAFSLHPPQSRTWSHSSPMRIYRALSVDHNLPVLTRHFHQNPIEDVCFLFNGGRSLAEMCEMYYDPIRLNNFIRPRVQAYNEIAVSRNNVLTGKLYGDLAMQKLQN